MRDRYPGGIISATPPTVSSSVASGVFTLAQAEAYKRAGTWPSPVFYIANLETTQHAVNANKTAALYAAVKNDGSQLLFTYYTTTPSWAAGYTSLGKVGEMDDYRGLIVTAGTYRICIVGAGGGACGASSLGGGCGGQSQATFTFPSSKNLILCVGAPGVGMSSTLTSANTNWGGVYAANNLGYHYHGVSWMDTGPNGIDADIAGAYGYGFGGAVDTSNTYVSSGYTGTGGGASGVVVADASWYMNELLMVAGGGGGSSSDYAGGVGIGATQYAGGNQTTHTRNAYGAAPSANGNGSSSAPSGANGRAGYSEAIYTNDLTRRHGGHASNAGGGGGGGYYSGGGGNHGGGGGGNGYVNSAVHSCTNVFQSGSALTSSNDTRQRTRYDFTNTYDIDALFPFLSATTGGGVQKIGYGGNNTGDGIAGPGCIIIERL